MGDARSAEKDDTYVPMAEALGVRFTPFVLYTYGGFHKSALSTIEQLAAAYDPAVALVPITAWKEDLKDRIAVCVQRHTANIVIEDDRRARSAGVLLRRRRPGRRSAARRRPRLSVAQRPLRSPVVELEQHAVGRRAASLCAALLTSVPALAPTTSAAADAAMSAPALTPDPVLPAQLPASASPEAAFVPGTRSEQPSSSSSHRRRDNKPIRCTVPNCRTSTTHSNDKCWTYYGFPPGHTHHDPKDWAAKASRRAQAAKPGGTAAAVWGEPILIDDEEEAGFSLTALSAMTASSDDPSVLEWRIDSNASRHHCRDRSWFSTYTPASSTVIVATGKEVQVAGHGTIHCLFPSNASSSEHRHVQLRNVQHVLSFAFNLLSVPTMDGCGVEARTKDGVCTLLDGTAAPSTSLPKGRACTG